MTGSRNVALVLSGALAKGGFEAGAIKELLPLFAKKQMAVRRIVATSAGALSGTVLAAGLRAGNGGDAAELLNHFWEYEATLRMFRPDLAGIASARGLFSMAAAHKMLRDHLHKQSRSPGARLPVSLSVVVARLLGHTVRIGDQKYSTFEHVLHFADRHFEDQHDRIINAACASGSVPTLFVPLELTDSDGHKLGPCADGGAVNNTPIKEALRADVDTIFLISPFPRVEPRYPGNNPIDLADHLMMILLNERLFRDLRESHWANSTIANIEKLVARRCTDPQEAQSLKDDILQAIGMPGAKMLRVVEIRPSAALEGSTLSALFSHRLRRHYLQAGMDAVRSQRSLLETL